eukprot:scaffold150379_cov12-Tisochrysis_lutea.AAC.1
MASEVVKACASVSWWWTWLGVAPGLGPCMVYQTLKCIALDRFLGLDQEGTIHRVAFAGCSHCSRHSPRCLHRAHGGKPGSRALRSAQRT